MLRTIVRWFFELVLAVFFRVRIQGREHLPLRGAALIIANHISYLDGFLIGKATPRYIRFLLWKPIYDIPVMQPFFRMWQLIPIHSEKPRQALESLKIARQEIEKGELVGIFPEGGITRSGEMDTFRRGYERIIDGTGAPVIPVYLEGMWGHPLSMKGGKLFACWERFWRPEIRVIIGPPIAHAPSPEELETAVRALASRS